MPAPEKPPVADIDEDPNVEVRPYSSPPCYAHEIDPAYFGMPDKADTPDAGRLRSLKRALHEIQAAIEIASGARLQR